MNQEALSARVRDIIGITALQTYFQPIFHLRDGELVGVEALFRPIAADGTIIAPSIVFRRAEQAGVLPELEVMALSNAMEEFDPPPSSERVLLFLNISSSLIDHNLLSPAQILSIARQNEIDPQSLVIEIVESSIVNDERLFRFASLLRDAGCAISLDNFGTFHSSFERIVELRPNVIKVDRAIVDAALDWPDKHAILKSVRYISNTIGALCLAEGIESRASLYMCMSEGLQLAQGFLLGRPVPTVEIATRRPLIRAHEHFLHIEDELRANLVHRSTLFQRVRSEAELLRNTLVTQHDDQLEEMITGFLTREKSCFECAYLINSRGIQISPTIVAPTTTHSSFPLFHPSEPGSDHSLKDYVYAPNALNRASYLTEPYLSSITGRLCRTLSVWFTSADKTVLQLCLDLQTSLVNHHGEYEPV